MARYTVELRWLVENNYSLNLDNYPIWSEDYRETLNDKIIQYYYFREIGFETPALFVNRLSLKMSLIMPYYNKLYKSTQLEFNPLYTTYMQDSQQRGLARDSSTSSSRGENVDTTTSSTVTGSSSGTSSGQSSSNSTQNSSTQDSAETSANGKKVSSDTPQGLLLADSVNDNTWASSADLDSQSGTSKSSGTVLTTTQVTSNDSTKTEGESSTLSDGTEKRNLTANDSSKTDENVAENITRTNQGYVGISPAELIMKYRESLINIDQMIIEELEDLFMQIY